MLPTETVAATAASGASITWPVVAGAAWAFIISIVQLIVLRHVGRVDKLSDKVDRVETVIGTLVTREALDKDLADMRTQRKEMHEDNKQTLREIMQQFQANANAEREERRATREIVGQLTTKVAVLADRVERTYKEK